MSYSSLSLGSKRHEKDLWASIHMLKGGGRGTLIIVAKRHSN